MNDEKNTVSGGGKLLKGMREIKNLKEKGEKLVKTIRAIMIQTLSISSTEWKKTFPIEENK